MKNQKNHKWTKEQREIILELLYKNYKYKDETVIMEMAAQSIGTRYGSIMGIYNAYKWISKGKEPQVISGGVGSFWVTETTDVYNEFVERNNISQKELDIMFS